MITTTPITSTRRFYRGTTANIAALTGMVEEDLAYDTTLQLLKRYTGTAWEIVGIYASSGLAGNRPLAADVPLGSLYYATDTIVLSQVQAGPAWVNVTQAWAKVSSGTFTGDGTANRAIAHGLGVVPKFYFAVAFNGANMVGFSIVSGSDTDRIGEEIAATPTGGAVTAMNATNVYIGTANPNYYGNINSYIYFWFAVA